MDVLERIYTAINSGSSQQSGIHVSAISYDCMRKAYYTQQYDGGFFSLKTLLTFWIGRQVHKTAILKEHEISLGWNGIVGTCDDYEDGCLLEKKTCTMIPKRANNHHVKQLEYYAVMLDKIGKPVTEAHVVYIDVSNKDIKAYPVKMRAYPIIEKEMLAKKEELEKAVGDKIPPKRRISWLCNYCSYADICFRGDRK